VGLLFATHSRYLDHVASPNHPERPARLEAVLQGARQTPVADALVPIEPRPATREELERVHPADYLDELERISKEEGGGWLDPDTGTSEASWDACRLGAGGVLVAAEALSAGEGQAAFCAVRPPGHHATRHHAMGFCLVNNVAVTAAALAEQGERVLIVDYDAHHGNGTQDIFYNHPTVFYASFHQWPLYPGTGSLGERGDGPGFGCNLNIPVPARATGDVYLAGLDRIVAPLAEVFEPTWLIISAGFDAHRRDPLTDLGLSAGDYALMTKRLVELVPNGRCLAVLEGGYDLRALADASAATMAALVGVEHLPEAPTCGGPGHRALDAVAERWADLLPA
jgi:acetoin utilization deacetylase AcuC-like enzyme